MKYEKYYRVTAYYSDTAISAVVKANDEWEAEDAALKIMANEWGARKIYRYEDIETRESF